MTEQATEIGGGNGACPTQAILLRLREDAGD